MRKSLIFIVLTLSCVVWTGCGLWPGKDKDGGDKSEDKPEKKADTEIVIPIQAETPTRADISAHFETNSRVEAEDQVQVTAEGVGECLKVYVEEGDRVKAGQVLAELDRAEMLAQIGQTEVNVRQTKTEYDRAAQGFKDGIMAEVERDNAKFAYEQALATLETQQVQLEKTTIRAPIGGIVTQRAVQEGMLVSAGAPVFSIVDPASYLLLINPPERRLPFLHEGQVAKVTLDALGDEEFEATVRRVNPNVDPITGLVKVTLDFDKETLSRLHEGAFARVRLIIDTHENALLVPKDAVLEENARRYVFVVEEKEEEEEDEEKDAEDDEDADTEDADAEAEEDDKDGDDGDDGGDDAEADDDDGDDDADAEADADADADADAEEDEGPLLVANRVEVETDFEDSDYYEIISGIDDTALIVTLGQHTLKSSSRVRLTDATTEILAKAGLTAEEALKAAEEKKAEKERKQKEKQAEAKSEK